MKYFLRRVSLLLSGTFISNKLIYSLIGIFNKYLLNRKIESIFLLYPANKAYIKPYCFDWYAKIIKWEPKIVGLYKQQNKWGIIFGLSSSDEDFFDPKNNKRLHELEKGMENIRQKIGAKQKSYAGVLPGILERESIINNPTSSENTALAVMRTIEKIRNEESIAEKPQIIILGSEGHIGKRVKQKLAPIYSNIFCVDLKLNNTDPDFWPKSIKCDNAIIINITKKEAFRDYVDKLWAKAIFVNEVYPEPENEFIEKIKNKGIHYYHIVGTKGAAWPSFPNSYKGGIPCCATISSVFYSSSKADIILKRV